MITLTTAEYWTVFALGMLTQWGICCVIVAVYSYLKRTQEQRS